MPQVGAYEGGDVVIVLGPPALAFGALLGALVSLAVHRPIRQRSPDRSAEDDLGLGLGVTLDRRPANPRVASSRTTAVFCSDSITALAQMLPLRCPDPDQKSGGCVHRRKPQRWHRQDGASSSTTCGLAG